MRAWFAAALALALAPAAWAQADETGEERSKRIDEIFDRGCGDDDGNDRCDAEVQRKMRELYGIASAEALMEEGVTLRRAMIVDGYGNDVVAISFSRAPGRPPTVEIMTPRGAERQPLRAAISQDIWDHVLGASANFDDRLVSELPQEGEDPLLRICLHGWFTVVEAADAAALWPNVVGQQMMPGKLRRDAEGSCAGGLAAPYAFALARIALQNLPECSSLASEFARNEPALLALCHALGGDRLAAADAMKVVEKLNGNNSNLPAEREFGWLFSQSGQHLKEPLRAALTAGNVGIYFGPPHAADADHAVAKGELLYWGEDNNSEVADIELQLVRETGDFAILSYEISEKRPVR